MTRRTGTTLLELVVALGITGVVALTGATAFRQLSLQRELALSAARATEQAAARRAVLADWLDHAIIESPAESQRREQRDVAAQAQLLTRRGLQGSAASKPAARGAGDALYFVTSVPPAGVPAGTRVRLYVDIDSDTPERGLTLEFRRAPGLPFERRQLDARITQLGVEFQDVATRRWHSTQDAGTLRAVAVRLRLPWIVGRDARLAALPLTFSMVRDDGATGDAGTEVGP
jgi:hypothetical protein